MCKIVIVVVNSNSVLIVKENYHKNENMGNDS